MNKSYVLLQMYDAVRLGSGIRISDCCSAYDISVATFRRYMAFLRGYFSEMYGSEIVYDQQAMLYRLKSNPADRT